MADNKQKRGGKPLEGEDFGDIAESLMERHGDRMEENAELARQLEDERAAAEVIKRIATLRARGVPREHAEPIATGTLFGTRSLGAARRWLTTRETILVLAGAPGCGKTQAAAWCVAQPPFRDYDGIHGPGGHWPGDLMPRFLDVSRLARMSRYDESLMTPLERCALLIIDDMGQEYVDAKGFFHSLIDGLINARHADQLKTIITTNLSRPDFELRYGPRVADRLRDGTFISSAEQTLRGGGATR